LKLEQWDQLDQTLERCLALEGVSRWDTLVEIVIIIHERTRAAGVESSATARIPDLLQKIINGTWKKDKDIVKFTRWIRVTFQMLSGSDDDELSLKLPTWQSGARKGTTSLTLRMSCSGWLQQLSIGL
jgi:hypothetical protein